MSRRTDSRIGEHQIEASDPLVPLPHNLDNAIAIGDVEHFNPSATARRLDILRQFAKQSFPPRRQDDLGSFRCKLKSNLST